MDMDDRKKSKQWRKENKIRKMTALVQISELNNRDRINAAAPELVENSTPSSDMLSDEPICKRLKLDEATSHSDDMLQAESELIDGSKKKYSEEELAELRALLKQSQKAKRFKVPSLRLTEHGDEAKLDISASDRVPLFLGDIQSLVLNGLLKNASPLIPRWCKLERNGQLASVRILLIEGAGISDYLLAKEKLPGFADSTFPFQLEVVMPSAYGGNLVEELCAVPMPRNEYFRLVKSHGSLKKALQKPNSGIFKILRAFFPVQLKPETPGDSDIDKDRALSADTQQSNKTVPVPSLSRDEKEDVDDDMKSLKKKVPDMLQSQDNEDISLNKTKLPDNIETQPVLPEEHDSSSNKSNESLDRIRPLKLHPSDKFPRTALLLSAWQMIEEDYPLLLNDNMRQKYHDFVLTKSNYKEVNSFSPMYGLDCEMCITTTGKSEVTRVGIVNEKHETVLDTLVLPYNKITNYVTKFSGITPAMLKDVTTRLEDVQEFIREYLEPDAILVGQSLQFDLKALKLMHPYCIDTSVILNVTGDRYRKSKLSKLSELFLNENIQTGKHGHSPVEDSLASLKLVQMKLSHSIEFGDEVLKNQGKQMAETWAASTVIEHHKKEPKPKEDISGYATSLFGLISRTGKAATIVSTPDILEKYLDYLDPTTLAYEEHGSSKSGSLKENGGECSKTGEVTCIIADTNKSVIERVAMSAPTSVCTLGHIQLSANESNSLALREDEILNEINQYVTHMQTSAPLNSLTIVVLCGREKSSNGVCLMNLRKETYQRLNFKPRDTSL